MKICPNCNYIRTEQDDLMFPEYECPSCGVIEKHKARYEFAQLEKKRLKERKAKQEKIKKEKEIRLRKEEARRRKEEEERLKREEEERLRREEEERRHREAEERKAREEEARKKKEEEERLKREEEERLRREEEKRRHREAEERKAREEEARRRNEEEERLKREEEKKRKAELARIQKEKEAIRVQQKRLEKTEKIKSENRDRIITSEEDTEEYQLFDMCPFAVSQTGKGLAFPTVGDKRNKLQHMRCMQKYCRLWTIKIDREGKKYAEGCIMQFYGLTEEEIIKNFEIKNEQIIGKEYAPDDLSVETDKEEDLK